MERIENSALFQAIINREDRLDPRIRVTSAQKVKAFIDEIRSGQYYIGITSGDFNPLDETAAQFIAQAADLTCALAQQRLLKPLLVVGVTADRSLKEPVWPEHMRARQVAQLSVVDIVMIMRHEDDLHQLKPDFELWMPTGKFDLKKEASRTRASRRVGLAPRPKYALKNRPQIDNS